MSRVKTLKKKMVLGAGAANAAEFIDSLLGKGKKDIGVIYPKYTNVKNHIEACGEALREMCSMPIMHTAKNEAVAAAILSYCDDLAKFSAEFTVNLSPWLLDLATAPAQQCELVFAQYERWKEHPLTASLIRTCNSLHEYRDKFATPSIEFVLNIAGAAWFPFQFINWNVKEFFVEIHNHPHQKKITEVVFSVMRVVHQHSYQIFEAKASPDIDVDQFVTAVIDCIDQLKKVPKLSRCGKAFKKIAASAKLFKGNFNMYYRDFVDTKDPNVILQNFITDVAGNSNDEDLTTMNEFRQILKYYEEKSNESGRSDPKIKQIFDEAMANLNKIDEMAPNLQREVKPAAPTKAKGGAAPAAQPANTSVQLTIEQINSMTEAQLMAFIGEGMRKKK